jgi:hypothetical protein|tara:strand:+ start:1492 stop:1671 length:180 start_codon:yes stop_codon:yes gene_type:complete
MVHSKKEVLKILEKNKISNFTTPEDQIMMKLKEAKDNAVGERIKVENLSEPLKDLLKEK